MLVQSKLSKPGRDSDVSKCDRRCCTQCTTINEPDHFTSTTISSVHQINQDLSCTSKDVVFLITCKKCKDQYVGQNCANPMNSHEYDIAQFPVTLTNVSLHFNSPRHSVQDSFYDY